MVLNTLQCVGQPPTTKNFATQNVRSAKWRGSALQYNKGNSDFLASFTFEFRFYSTNQTNQDTQVNTLNPENWYSVWALIIKYGLLKFCFLHCNPALRIHSHTHSPDFCLYKIESYNSFVKSCLLTGYVLSLIFHIKVDSSLVTSLETMRITFRMWGNFLALQTSHKGALPSQTGWKPCCHWWRRRGRT